MEDEWDNILLFDHLPVERDECLGVVPVRSYVRAERLHIITPIELIGLRSSKAAPGFTYVLENDIQEQK